MVNNHEVAEWVKLHKVHLYKIGYLFIQDEEKLENVIETVVKATKDPTDFSELEFGSTFVKECLKKANGVQKLPNNLFQNLSLSYVPSLYLVYVLGIPTRIAAKYLSITEEQVDKNISFGLQELVGNDQVSVWKLVDYHFGRLSFSEYIEVNQLLKENEANQNALETIISFIEQLEQFGRTLTPSQYFLEGNRPLTEIQLKNRKRKQYTFTTVAGLFFVMLLFVSSVGVAEIQHKWKIWTSPQVGFGESVYVSAVDQGIEITVTHVAADAKQTLLYYEIRDVEGNYHYNMDMYHDYVEVLNKDYWAEYWSIYSRPREHEKLTDDTSSQGVLILPALAEDEELITLRFHKVDQYPKGLNFHESFEANELQLIEGEWILEVPVVKYEPIYIDIDQTLDVRGKTFLFTHIVLSPTVTILGYKMQNPGNGGRYDYHDIQLSVEADGKRYLPFYDHRSHDNYRFEDWDRLFPIESLYYLPPKELDIVINQLFSNYLYETEIDIDYDNLPMDFSFLENNITISHVEKGNPTIIILKEEYDENRSYDYFHLDLYRNFGNDFGYGMSSEGVWLDNQGNKYLSHEELAEIDNHDDIKYISTEQRIELFLHDGEEDDIVLPEKLFIHSYTKNHRVNERLRIQLK